MGGVSDGSLLAHSYKDKSFDASANNSIELEVAGNNESYNLHVRTTDLWLPWQSYRSSFIVTQDWQTIRIPFSSIEPYLAQQKSSARTNLNASAWWASAETFRQTYVSLPSVFTLQTSMRKNKKTTTHILWYTFNVVVHKP